MKHITLVFFIGLLFSCSGEKEKSGNVDKLKKATKDVNDLVKDIEDDEEGDDK